MNSDNYSTTFTFNLTWACKTGCSYCYRALNQNQSDIEVLSTDDLVKHARLAKQLGISEYRFSGGEPLLVGDTLFEYAEIVYEITGLKPVVMTSGFLIDDAWLKKATNKFSAIAISVDNPYENKRSKRLIELISENTCDETPLTYGLTLINRRQFKNISRIFSEMYKSVDYKFMPQFDYPCLGNVFEEPNDVELTHLTAATSDLFREYDLIPYYFVYLVGSLMWLKEDRQRLVLNLHPEGNYQIYDSPSERLDVEYRWRQYLLQQQSKSRICQSCDWEDACRHHPQWDLRYDWCSLRKAMFEGMYNAFSI